MRAFALLALAFSLSGSADPAEVPSRQGTVSVAVKLHGSFATTAPRSLTLVFTRVSSTIDAAALRADVAIREGGVEEKAVDVVLPQGHWTLDVESPVLWHATQSVAVTPGTTAQIVVDVWPKATIAGRVDARGATATPDELRIRFESVESPNPPSFAGEVPCRIVDAAFQCSFPTGTFHLRIRPRGFIAQYRQNLQLAVNSVVDLGTLQFREGQSITGRLRLDSPRTITVAVTPAKTPAGERWHVRLSEEVAERVLDPRTESNATADGRWASPPLQPGRYWLTVGTMEGDVWHAEEIRLDQTDRDIPVAIVARSLHGTVKFGEEPLQASLTFTTP